MATRRSSQRIASQQSSTPVSSQSKSSAGTKRKSDASSSSAAKKGKKGAEKQQKTLEQTIDGPDIEAPAQDTDKNNDVNMSDAKHDKTEDKAVTNDQDPSHELEQASESKDDDKKVDVNARTEAHKPTNGTSMPNDAAITQSVENSKKTEEHTNGDTAIEAGREDDTPSSILEKGIIYFFFRSRVGVDEPQDVNDIARSFMVMRPIPHGAKLGDGPIGDDGNCRLLAVPKKVLPRSGKDRFMVFVEKAKTSFKDLKENFLSSSDYSTQTQGQRHSPAVTPVAEGVYAITTTGRESHLAYILTIPAQINEVQEDVGLKQRGSFVLSTKNPNQKGPANASLPKGPEYPQEILDEFRNLRWMPTQPKHLEYANAQFLIIGESTGLDHALEPQPRDQKHDKETPLEEMEKLEGEDEIRIKHLKGDDAVFADLGLSSQEYPKVPSTW